MTSGESVLVRLSHTDGNLNSGAFAIDFQLHPGLFETVYELPNDALPCQIDSSTQINVDSGGTIEEVSLGQSDDSSHSIELNFLETWDRKSGTVTYLCIRNR